MTERTELINDIEKLKAERNRLLRQVEEAEQWEGTAWDSFNSLAEHIRATEKKQRIAQNSVSYTHLTLPTILRV